MLSVRTHVVIIHRYVKTRPWASARENTSFPPPLSGGGGPTHSGPLFVPYLLSMCMVSFRLPVERQVSSVLLQAALWLLAAGLRGIRGCSTRKAPPCEAGGPRAGPCPGRNLSTRAGILSESF